MKKTLIAMMIALIALPAIGAQAEEKEYRPGAIQQNDLSIDVWVDNEDGVYYEGESITIFFHATRDCFVAIYSLDTRGQINLLYPTNPWDNGYVYGGEVYAIPADHEEYELVVTGPEGLEYIQAVASLEEMNIPEWYEGTSLRADNYENDENFLDRINGRYFTCRWDNQSRTFDRTTVYVKTPHYYYKPVYTPRDWYDYPQYSMVYIDYPFGAEIYIDGIYFGIAPLWIPRVMIGWHWVTIYDRYGYCWEDHIHFVHNNTIRLDRTRVVTSRSKISRFKDVRTQAKKYNRSSYLLSDQKVTNVRTSDRDAGRTYRDSQDRTRKITGDSKERTRRIEDSWNRKSPSGTDSKKSGDRSRDGSNTSGNDYRRTTPDSRKSTGDTKRGSDVAPSRSTTKSGGEGSTRSIDRSGSSTKSSGTDKSNVNSTKKSGTPKSSSGSKSSSSSRKDGNVSKSSGSDRSSSVGRTSSGRSSSSKSSSSRSSSKSGGSKR